MGQSIMARNRIFIGLGLVLALGACSGTPVTRNIPLETPPVNLSAAATPAALPGNAAGQTPRFGQSAYNVVAFNMHVPEDLRISEANSYYPIADIVWRGDPYGDRRAQIKAIFDTSFAQVQPNLTGTRPVQVDVVLTKFHSLTEKTRYTVGGSHSIGFELTLKDAETGQILVDRKHIRTELKGFGGMAAIRADQQGQTQKVRITEHLRRLLLTELTLPQGWQDQDRKLQKAVSQI
jgi:hypothetical protein